MALDLFQHGQMILQISSFEKLLHHKVSELIIRQLHLETQMMHPLGTRIHKYRLNSH